MALHVIVGKGPVGTTTGRGTRRRGPPGAGPVPQRRGLDRAVEHREVDATDAEALTAAARRGRVYNAVNPAYHRWATDWPPVAAALLTAAERTGAVLVTMTNLYGYGRPSGPMTPERPLAATDVKGRVRNRMWADALAATEAGRVRVTEARASDFVGPQVPLDQSHLMRQIPTLRKGARAWVIGDPDVRRSWGYMPDVAATLATLGTDERALGRAWHVPSAPPRSQRQALEDLAAALGAPPPRVSGIPWPVLRATGVVVPFLREVAAMRHQFDQDFVVDASATTATFGIAATPWDEVIRATAGACGDRLRRPRGPSLPWGHGFCLGSGHPGVVGRARLRLRRAPPRPQPKGGRR